MNVSNYPILSHFDSTKESNFNNALRIAKLNSKALAILAVISLVATAVFVCTLVVLARFFWVYIGQSQRFYEQDALLEEQSRRLSEQDALLNQTDQMLDRNRSLNDLLQKRNIVEREIHARILLECADAEEKRRQALVKCSQNVNFQHLQNFKSALNRETAISNQLLEATNVEIQTRTLILDSVISKVSQRESELGILARRYREYYKTWGQQDALVFEFIPPELLKILIAADKKTMIEGFLRHQLFETCSISFEPIFDFNECVFLDTNPRVAFSYEVLNKHLQANGLICPTTRNRVQVAYFPFRSSNFDILSDRPPSDKYLATIAATFQEYRRQRVDALVRETNTTFNITCSVSDPLGTRPAITIAYCTAPIC